MFIVNVEAAIHREGKWFVIERSKKEEHAGGLLSLVGGTVDNEGDAQTILEKTLIREVYEEVGVRVKENMKLVSNTSFSIADGREVLNIVFLCELDQGEPFVKSPDEVEGVHWLSTDEIHHHPNAPVWLKESIRYAEELLDNSKHNTK
ncbi:NUDIX domain-containing protein [Neobacillus niacini]|uniref:NUDIX hydrolase n=1 Tax=Neobacillus niacini TaxID=86668 RepID=UPI002860D829|nr:NUDIX domain-containing protein [Neobacillus niacini]MDR7000740.1 8-oxo-dGTP pyrophosphatase MutT (NUDIX family) [Neobacillus niacini]